MKKTLILFILLSVLGSAFPGNEVLARSTSAVDSDLQALGIDAFITRKDMKSMVKTQSSNYEVLNRLNQTKIKTEEMIKRENIAKACKVVDVGFTAAGIVTGGAGLAAKEGGKAALKWMLGKVATEGAKEAAGVPGYSDAVKVGVFIFNKANQNELSGQLSKGDIEILLKAQKLLEEDSDGRSLQEKLPDLRDMISGMEAKVQDTDARLNYLSTHMDELKKTGDQLNKEFAGAKKAEEKENEKKLEEAKKAQPKNLVNTETTKPADVPPPTVGPKDTPEEKRRKVQEAINKYINSLAAKINEKKKAADDAWTALEKPKNSVDYATLPDSLMYLENSLSEHRTYINMQSIERSAKTTAESIKRYAQELENYKNEIKAKIEPIITDITDYTGQWRTIYNTYKPQGYYVSEPDDVKGMTAWSAYYESPLKYVETYKAGTEGFESKFKDIESRARSEKDRIYTETMEFISDYVTKTGDFKNYEPQTAGRINEIMQDLAKKSEIIYSLPNDFVNEFAYNGKRDLAELEAKISAAKSAFSGVQDLSRSGLILYSDLADRAAKLSELAASPSMSEASAIAYSSENEGHKKDMVSILKKIEDFSPRISLTDGGLFLQTAPQNISNLMFGAEEAIKYLKTQNARILAVHNKAIKEFNENASKDLTYLEKADNDTYGKEIEKIFAPSLKLEEDTKSIIDEVKRTFLFDPGEDLKPKDLVIKNGSWGQIVDGKSPLLFQTGFWTREAAAKREEYDKATTAFWTSEKGQKLNEARRIKDLGDAQDKREPGSPVIRKMYDDFKQAYEARNASRVMSFIDDGWASQDGTSASDLEEHFSRIFRVFNEISFNISNLNIINEGNNIYTVSYELDITSKIYSKNIKREEKSSVYEKVRLENGKAKIFKTENGSYWLVK